MADHCQDCTGCCQVFEVKEISKPFGTSCRYLGPTKSGPGCQIYENRPQACQTFVCLWLEGQRQGGWKQLEEELRPDICKVVFGWPWAKDRLTMFVYPYPGHPDAWKTGAPRRKIEQILMRGGKVLVYQDKEHVISMIGDMAMIGTEKEFVDLLFTA